jgi:hypothetical protein
MKKILLLITIALFVSINTSSQICALGNFIIEKNDFTIAKGILNRYNYILSSDRDVEALGNNPNTKIIGTKGTDPTNSIMVTVEALNLKNNGIKMVTFICAKGYAIYLETDLSETGYNKTKEREYVEDGRFNVIEKTYLRTSGSTTDTVVIKFTPSGAAQVTFKRVKEVTGKK